jgi:hypothetical protein
MANMTIAEFKYFRKAVAVLTRVGIGRNEAIDLLLSHMQETRERRRNYTNEMFGTK